ncbi:MAG: response regulator [Atribacterota bacterium]
MKKRIFTTFQIAKYCNVDISTVAKWIDGEKLKAYKTPGGHRRVKRKDLLEFIQKHDIPMPPELEKIKPRVLVVDDNKMIVRNIKKALNRKLKDKLEIEVAFDGYQAGRMIDKFLPDLIILDINLPGVDGFKIVEDIKSNKELKDMKILIITGVDVEESREKMKSYDVDKFFAKPFGIKEIVSEVAGQLGLPKENR